MMTSTDHSHSMYLSSFPSFWFYQSLASTTLEIRRRSAFHRRSRRFCVRRFGFDVARRSSSRHACISSTTAIVASPLPAAFASTSYTTDLPFLRMQNDNHLPSYVHRHLIPDSFGIIDAVDAILDDDRACVDQKRRCGPCPISPSFLPSAGKRLDHMLGSLLRPMLMLGTRAI